MCCGSGKAGFRRSSPVKRAGGRRYYRPADVALLAGIKRLLHDEGLTIRGVQKILREQGVRHVAGLADGDVGARDVTPMTRTPRPRLMAETCRQPTSGPPHRSDAERRGRRAAGPLRRTLPPDRPPSPSDAGPCAPSARRRGRRRMPAVRRRTGSASPSLPRRSRCRRDAGRAGDRGRLWLAEPLRGHCRRAPVRRADAPTLTRTLARRGLLALARPRLAAMRAARRPAR